MQKQYLSVGGTISEPPRFDSENYDEFRRSLWFWREVNRQFGDNQLLSKLALTAEGSMEVLMIKFLRQTRDNVSQRSLKGIVAELDGEYPKPAQEKQIKKINDLVNFSRRQSEDIRSFWIRYEQVKHSLSRIEQHYFAGVTTLHPSTERSQNDLDEPTHGDLKFGRKEG